MIEIISISRDARALIKQMALSLLLPSRFSVPSSCLASRPSLVSVRIFLSNKFFSSQRHFIKHMSCNTTSSEPAAATAEGNAAGEDNREPNDVLVQYVVLRRDLIESWPLGSVVTQGCHASIAAIWSNRDDDLTARYCSDGNLDSMHKVTLEVKGEAQILNLSEKLKEGGITHKLWIEQPENIPTCLATKPYPKSVVSSFFRRLKLCK